MATDSNILAWRIPWTEEPGGLQSWGHRKAGHNLATKQQQCSSRKDWRFLLFETFTYSLRYYFLSLHNGQLKSGAFYTLKQLYVVEGEELGGVTGEEVHVSASKIYQVKSNNMALSLDDDFISINIADVSG